MLARVRRRRHGGKWRLGGKGSRGTGRFDKLLSIGARALSSAWLEQRTHNPSVAGSTPAGPMADGRTQRRKVVGGDRRAVTYNFASLRPCILHVPERLRLLLRPARLVRGALEGAAHQVLGAQPHRQRQGEHDPAEEDPERQLDDPPAEI